MDHKTSSTTSSISLFTNIAQELFLSPIFLPMVGVHKYAPFPLFAQPSLKPLKAILVRNTLHVAEIEESLLNGKVKVVFKG